MGLKTTCCVSLGSLKLLPATWIIILKMMLIQMLSRDGPQGLIDTPKCGNNIGTAYHCTRNRAQPMVFQSEESLSVKLRSRTHGRSQAIPDESPNPNKSNPSQIFRCIHP